jgi:beta-glucosidase-like glycosyl hydrolase
MDAFLEQLNNTELMSLVQGKMPASNWGDIERYGIPKGTVSDGPAGLRAGTYWPVAVTQACTWNVALIEQMGLHIGSEGYNLGVDIWLAPALNIHRNPLNGRNFEYYSEDPLISGTMAAAAVSGCQAQGVLVTLKHLAANNCEAHRTSSDSRMSERALREIYLEGFRVALKLSDAWGIMTSYNRINSIEPAESYDILTTIVRGEWGYDGLIMSDWWNDSSEVGELIAGNNLKMPEGNQGELIAALNNGWLTRDHLKTSAKYILEAMFRVDRLKEMFDPAFKHVEATEPLRPTQEEKPDADEGEKETDTQKTPDENTPTVEENNGARMGLWAAIGAGIAAAAAVAVAVILGKKKKK